jgi:preprotein translocase subunit YajC
MRLNFGKIIAVALVAASPAAFSAAHAQAVGMQVVDTAGAPVGTVTAIEGDNVKVKTDKHEVLLPKASFRADQGKLVFAMTQAQLDSKVEEAAAASAKSIAPGATVNGSAGTALGKIESVDNGQVTIALTSGKKIKVPSTGLRGNADGTVTIGYTAEQLEALLNSSAAPSSGSSSTASNTAAPTTGK